MVAETSVEFAGYFIIGTSSKIVESPGTGY